MALKIDSSILKEILDFLQDLGCCRRCSLRFTGFRNSKEYQIKKEDDEPNGKAFKSNPCISCIGLIQDSLHENGIVYIQEELAKAGYDAETFMCTLSTPVSLLLREHALWLSLLSKFSETYGNLTKAEFITSLKDVWKFINAEKIEKAIRKKFELNQSPFQVQIRVLYKDDESECLSLIDMNPEKFRKRFQKTKVFRGEVFTRNGVQSFLCDVSADTFNKHYNLTIPDSPFHYGDINCQHSPLYIAGRYNKFSRKLCQTPWIIDGAKHMETSIQELIVCHLEPFFKVSGSKFSSSGREDVDVRMLGKGRPFALELINPHHTACDQKDMGQLENLINSSTKDIAVHHLQLVTKEQLSDLKEGEENKRKNYSALCILLDGGSISEKDIKLLTCMNLDLLQKTPLRVLHRRPLAARKRTVYEMVPRLIVNQPNYFVIKLKTQAGTYIKEFVHGDFNRTTPNLCSILGREVDIVALDVDDVDLDWPPSV